MYFLGTQMHMVTFGITVFELLIFTFQIFYWLGRPGDKKRLWYLFLLLFLILYNVFSGLFPDQNIPVPVTLQILLAYASGIAISMYFVFYFYKAFQLDHLKFFAIYGTVLFILGPFILVFAIPYYITNNLELCRKMLVIVPFVYSIAFIYSVTRAFVLKHKEKKYSTGNSSPEIIAAYLALLFFASLPVIVYFGDFQVLEHSVTNAGFLVMTVVYIRSSLIQYKSEYIKLQDSQRKLVEVNQHLQEMVNQRTEELERVNAERTRELEKVIAEQTEAFIILTHETKTPLTLINNYLDELTLCRKISEMEEYGHIPLIFLSAKNTDHDKITAFRAGAFDYIKKPFVFSTLFQKIEAILTKFEKHRWALFNGARKNMMRPENRTNVFELNCKYHGLTKKETEIAKLLRNSLYYKEIAGELKITENTVAKHIQNMYNKVNVSQKLELIQKLEGKEEIDITKE